MKIVTFVDTLGFKQKITSINHEEAKEVIKRFNSEIYKLWRNLNYDKDHTIHGQTFSDSLIIYTDDNTVNSLRKVLIFLRDLYRVSILKCDLPLRGGISIGDFDRIPATEFNNLQKELVVGTAFIDAYFLESANKVKGSKIIYRQNVHNLIIEHLSDLVSQEIIILPSGESLFEMIWGGFEYLEELDFEALHKFVELGTKSKWLDHYYHTLVTFLTKASSQKKHQIFTRIIDDIKREYKYNDLDNFIENFIRTDGIANLKKSFLSYIRTQFDK